MSANLHKDIHTLYAFADKCGTLADLIPALYDVLRRNEAALHDVTYAYRLVGTDSGYSTAFALDHGHFTHLTDIPPVDVTVTGTDANLLAIFQRKQNPMTALLLGKVKLNGSKAALVKLASFL